MSRRAVAWRHSGGGRHRRCGQQRKSSSQSGAHDHNDQHHHVGVTQRAVQFTTRRRPTRMPTAEARTRDLSHHVRRHRAPLHGGCVEHGWPSATSCGITIEEKAALGAATALGDEQVCRHSHVVHGGQIGSVVRGGRRWRGSGLHEDNDDATPTWRRRILTPQKKRHKQLVRELGAASMREDSDDRRSPRLQTTRGSACGIGVARW